MKSAASILVPFFGFLALLLLIVIQEQELQRIRADMGALIDYMDKNNEIIGKMQASEGRLFQLIKTIDAQVLRHIYDQKPASNLTVPGVSLPDPPQSESPWYRIDERKFLVPDVKASTFEKEGPR